MDAVLQALQNIPKAIKKIINQKRKEFIVIFA